VTESQVRRVKLSNLPSGAALKNVASLVWGGNIQEFNFTPGNSWAEVLFLHPNDCKKYFDATPNGVQYPSQTDRFVTIELCPAESAHEMVKDIVSKQMTRCIRVIDYDAEWSKIALARIAAGAEKTTRAVDCVVTGKNGAGVSSISLMFPH